MVGLLSRSKSGPVNTILPQSSVNDAVSRKSEQTVDVWIDPFVQLVYFCPKLGRVEIHRGFVCGKIVVEGRVEDADDLGTLVVHNSLKFLVPQNWDGESADGQR